MCFPSMDICVWEKVGSRLLISRIGFQNCWIADFKGIAAVKGIADFKSNLEHLSSKDYSNKWRFYRKLRKNEG